MCEEYRTVDFQTWLFIQNPAEKEVEGLPEYCGKTIYWMRVDGTLFINL
jgi:hypothetical protein